MDARRQGSQIWCAFANQVAASESQVASCRIDQAEDLGAWRSVAWLKGAQEAVLALVVDGEEVAAAEQRALRTMGSRWVRTC